ncbi:hypothetical protein HNY73_003311 [Argiope bruennichi]|uniref:Uncharacterized protein n=1 Tax=Argiope bruennichi TaxID=94029 RepID=A0A8T0FXN7_ARGBR|nr:hypothetical protein HNY73_003311 [Argiope bruennichi]
MNIKEEVKDSSITDKTQQSSIFRGLVLALLSGASFSVVSMMVKKMKNLHPGQLAVSRHSSCLCQRLSQLDKILWALPIFASFLYSGVSSVE